MGGRSTARLATLALAAVLITVPAIASVAASVPGVDEAPWGAWRAERVAPTVFGETDIALTPDGEVRVLADAGFQGVYVAHRTLTGWTASPIEQQASAGGLAIADDGTEWAGYKKSFSSATASRVHVAWRQAAGEAWTVEDVGEGFDPDLALGSNDAVHVVHGIIPSDGTIELHYVTRTGPGSFDAETIVSDSFSSLKYDDPALAVDDQGRVHAVFVDQHDGDWTQRYALRETSGSWSFDWLDQCNQNPADIATDLLDQAHVVCHSGGTGVVHYEQTVDGWVSEPVATPGDTVPPRSGVGFEPNIAIDDEDGVHVSFRTGFNGFFPDDPTHPAQLYYAYRDDSPDPGENIWTTGSESEAWRVEPVDARGTGVGFGSSVAVDEDGRPELAYLVRWRVNALGCRGPVDACFDLDHAEPVSATAAGALDRAS